MTVGCGAWGGGEIGKRTVLRRAGFARAIAGHIAGSTPALPLPTTPTIRNTMTTKTKPASAPKKRTAKNPNEAALANANAAITQL